MSDAYLNAAFLTLSGGMQDAYTYCLRGEVFANAQTGNIVLMSSHLFRGDFGSMVRYLIPLCAFVAGTFAAELIHRHFKYIKTVHWRQLVLLLEIALLFWVGWMPISFNIAANAMVSFVCAMQVQSFRKVHGKTYASTMCIGNLRSATEAFCGYLHTKNKEVLYTSLRYFGVIFLFAIGAGVGWMVTVRFGTYGIWFCCLLLMISFAMMFVKEEIEMEQEEEVLAAEEAELKEMKQQLKKKV